MKNIIITVIITSVLLTACGNADNSPIESMVTTENIVKSGNIISETTVVSTSDNLSETDSETSVENVTEHIVSEPYNWDGFVLSEHCGEFDEVMPLKYSLLQYKDESVVCKEHLDSAYQAIIESKYYNEVIEFGKSYLEWNGSDFVTGEEDFNFLLNNFPDYIDYEAAPNLVLKPKFINCIQLPFDGVNIEEIMLFSFPLAESEIEWSGTSLMYIVVYVNAWNEAKVLYNVSAQTLSTQINPIKFSNGVIHLEFGRGHTSGTSRSTILSFSNGNCNVEYEGIAMYFDEEGYIMMNDISAFNEHNILVFYDGLRDCYCEIKKVPLSDELTRAILSDENIAEHNYFKEDYPDREPVYAVGGKYIATYNGAFEFDDGIIVPFVHGEIIPSYEENGKPALNVNLNSETFK